MQKMFLIANGQKISYDYLLNQLNQSTWKLKSIFSSIGTVDFFISIIRSLLLDRPITIVDSDLSGDEVKALLKDEYKLLNKENHIGSDLIISDQTELIKKIQETVNWRISLFTSGSTGMPKRITHNFASLTRNVKIGKKYSTDIWGLAYNPSHMAGLQVFFQALLNLNPMIYLFDKKRREIFDLIDSHQITNISATPTFFRCLLPINKQFPCVNHITMGGERFDENLEAHLKQSFHNAKIHNIYASTEAASLFNSNSDVFSIDDRLGKLIKVESNELFLHESLMGECEYLKKNGDSWYSTGDIVEIVSEDPFTFKFVSRKDELINIGGYKVSPYEIEAVLLKHPLIKDCLVYSRPSSVVGNILCADVISDSPAPSIFELRKFLGNKIQDFKIPRIINFVEELKQTRSKKKKRN